MADLRKKNDGNSIEERARKIFPSGGFGNLKADLVIESGSGGRVRDHLGKEYIDFVLGSGPMLVGHAHPDVTEAVEKQLSKGTTFFALNESAIELAEMIVAAVPCAEQLRFVSSGSEATLYTMRLARAFTGKEKILKFEGGYHGMNDYALMSMAPKKEADFPQPLPDSAGIPTSVGESVLIAPFNDLETTKELLIQNRNEVAAVIVEPFQRLISPKPGFLEGLRELTASEGVLLIFDEVVTGFRFSYQGAQGYYGVVPDLCALGKVIGGGFPLAAVAGSRKLFDHFDSEKVGASGYLPQIGTLSGNPVASVAGIATLKILSKAGAYEEIFETGRVLMAGIEDILKSCGVEAQVIGEPPLFDVVFGSGSLDDYRAVAACDISLLGKFNQSLRSNGVLKGDTKFYVSLAHTSEDVQRTLEAVDLSIKGL
jgi:glutamate-1-semialdehyde 2,1-aminomutase|tara:strand:+ start:922 stop:2202 length:1281 start_codon:yes stop_codon:yes gene_type:complete